MAARPSGLETTCGTASEKASSWSSTAEALPESGPAAAAAAKKAGGSVKMKTVGGAWLTFTDKAGKVYVTDEAGGTARITIADVEQSNGVILVVNKVLLPKS